MIKASVIKAKASHCLVDMALHTVEAVTSSCCVQSDFKGNPGFQMVISLQNNGKSLLYLPKI